MPCAPLPINEPIDTVTGSLYSCYQCWTATVAASTIGDALRFSESLSWAAMLRLQRLLVHGLCDFYNLACHSFTTLEGERVTKVQAKGNAGCPISVTCSEFLHEMCGCQVAPGVGIEEAYAKS